MKCKKCGHDMKKTSTGSHSYEFVCTWCGRIIRSNKEAERNTAPEDNKQEAESNG